MKTCSAEPLSLGREQVLEKYLRTNLANELQSDTGEGVGLSQN